VCRISEIKDYSTVRPSTTTVTAREILGELAVEINGTVEVKRAIREDIYPLSLVVSWRVHDADVASLNKVVSNQKVLLVRRDLNIVRSDDALVLVQGVKALWSSKIGDVNSRNVVGERVGEVRELAILRDIRATTVSLKLEVFQRGGSY
jgi:hypothetical protein